MENRGGPDHGDYWLVVPQRRQCHSSPNNSRQLVFRRAGSRQIVAGPHGRRHHSGLRQKLRRGLQSVRRRYSLSQQPGSLATGHRRFAQGQSGSGSGARANSGAPSQCAAAIHRGAGDSGAGRGSASLGSVAGFGSDARLFSDAACALRRVGRCPRLRPLLEARHPGQRVKLAALL
jgi:hypothetical protein